jgi:hypothetical protein
MTESRKGLERSSKVTCRDMDGLMRLLGHDDDGLRPSESLLRRINAGILKDLRPIPPLVPSRILLGGCAIVFLSVVAVGTLLLGTNGWSALSLLQRIVVFLTLSVSAVLLAVSVVRQMVPGSKHIFAPAVLLVSILIALMMVIAATFRSQPEGAFLASGVMCMKNGLTYSIPAAFLLWLILRRGALLYPKITGAVAGGLAGLAGLSVLEMNCPNLNLLHILVWHAGVVVIGSGGGALLGAAVESFERWHKQVRFSL